MGGNYKPLLEFEPTSLRLTARKDKDTGAIVTIKTAKKDFKVTDVQFKETGKDLDWKAYVPLQYSMSPADSARPVKDTVKMKKPSAKGKPDAAPQETMTMIYKLKISCTSVSNKDQYGEFTIKTNMTEKPEIKISGSLEAKKD